METQITPEKLLLIVSSDKSTGRHRSSYVKGQVTLNTWRKTTEQGNNSIRLQTTDRVGNTYTERENILINISFADGSLWSGTFGDLKHFLIK